MYGSYYDGENVESQSRDHYGDGFTVHTYDLSLQIYLSECILFIDFFSVISADFTNQTTQFKSFVIEFTYSFPNHKFLQTNLLL